MTLLLTGLSGAGKTTIGRKVVQEVTRTRAAILLDGDQLRQSISRELGYAEKDRVEHLRRVGELSLSHARAGAVVVATLIAPHRYAREAFLLRHSAAGVRCFEVYVCAPIEVCIERDPKQLYRRQAAKDIKGMSGLDAPYDRPLNPSVILRTDLETCDESTRRVLDLLRREGHMGCASH